MGQITNGFGVRYFVDRCSS